MSRSSNVYDVAEAAGVSTATVSRFFRAPEKLSEAARKAVGEAVRRLDYIPSGSARALAERQTGAIGLYSFSGHEPDELVMPARVRGDRGAGPIPGPGVVARVRDDPMSPRLFPLFADEVLHGVELECTLRGLPLVVGWQHGSDAGLALEEVSRRVDGVVVLPSTISPDELGRLMRTRAVVLLGRSASPGALADAITVDNEGGMAAMAEHLVVDHGVTDFWYAGPEDGAEHEARRRGWDSALSRLGAPPSGPAIVETGSREAARVEISGRLEESSPPRAIVCASDQTALGVMEALREAGFAVPDDVIVTGFDGIDAGRFVSPALTTVRQPMGALGRISVQLLSERIADPALPARGVELPVELVLRGSCGCGPV
ncbi:LacI family DNA-binding transcriptional regulator [Microbacterium sp. NPDC056052]|uniref:LacI family DNA-binding transcriptional regulator n=1 Tax=Microbacterium sp. NPDC056052 TaxID=3345695 RepID=UPI0035E271D0